MLIMIMSIILVLIVKGQMVDRIEKHRQEVYEDRKEIVRMIALLHRDIRHLSSDIQDIKVDSDISDILRDIDSYR